MIQLLTLSLVILLILERIGYYLSVTRKGEIKNVWKSFLEFFKIWKKVKRYLYRKMPIPPSEIANPWFRENFDKIYNTEEKKYLGESAAYLGWKRVHSEEELAKLEEAKKLRELCYQEDVKSFLEWYKSNNHWLYYQLMKLKILSPPIH